MEKKDKSKTKSVDGNVKSTTPRTIDQMTFARLIAQKQGYKISDVVSIIEAEQKLTMEYAKMGYKVIKKNYLTIETRRYAGKQNWTSPLNGRKYDLPATTRILVRVGDGFKQYIDGKLMPEKLCRFVNVQPETTNVLP